jgi:membrane-associated phospholipid phosphatase
MDMETILQWGLGLIRTVQGGANPALTAFMKAVTNFGAAPAYMILLPLIYWCIDEKKGFRLGLAIMASTWINLSLKFLCKQPRPFWPGWDPSVGMIKESLYGLPSGHAQISLTMWSIVASWFKKWQAWVAAVLIILLVGFSRIYLGVHFPTDLAAGWILGALVLAVYFLCTERFAAFLLKGGMRVQFIVSAAAAFVMILYNPQAAREIPNAVQSLIMPGGVVLGMGFGYSIAVNKLKFNAAAVFGRRGAAAFFTRAARFLLGIAGVVLVFIIFSMLRRLLGIEEGGGTYRLAVFLQFACLELWIYAGAPWCFRRIRLAEGAAKKD